MAAPATTVELLDQVAALGLCDPDRLTGAFPADQPLPETPADVARLLVRDGVCTKYQAKLILAGKGRRLLLGKYRLLRPLGKGGGGSVFLGEHADIRRRVAVKVLRGGSTADTLAVERFRREARAAAALDHPNIVKLFDFGVSQGVPYLVMEYATGKTLQQLLDSGGPLTVPAAVYVATQTALGLGHAHDRGIVHRDIKPLNLMVAADGGVKMLDMGLARALDRGEDRLTEQAESGTVAGTIDYMSPEQCNGVSVNERADIYSLGATLFTLLTGRPMFVGTPAEKLAQLQTTAPPALDQQVPSVPPQLARVVEKMLAKRPTDRFTSCDEVVAALAPWCPSEPPSLGVIDPQKTVNIRPARRSTSDWSADCTRPRPARRRWQWWVGAVASAVALAVGLAVLFVPSPAGPSPVVTAPADEGLTSDNPESINELVFAPDGRRLYGIDWGGGVCVWDAATRQRIDRRSVKAGGIGNHLSLAADGRVLVCGNKMPTATWDVSAGEVVKVHEERAVRTWSAVMSPDGKWVLIATDSDVGIRSATTGERVRAFDPKMGYVWSAAFSADGKRVAAGGREAGEGAGVIAVWDADTGATVHRLGGHIWDVRWVAFNADGTKLASCGFDNEIRVWNLTTGECERTFTDENTYVERVTFLPDGGLLSVSACDYRLPEESHTSAVCVWDPVRPEPTPVWVRRLPGRATSVAYSPAAGVFAVANKSKQVWVLPAPPEMK